MALNRTYWTPVLGKFLLYKYNAIILVFSQKSPCHSNSVFDTSLSTETVETYWLQEPTSLWPSANRTYPNYSRWWNCFNWYADASIKGLHALVKVIFGNTVHLKHFLSSFIPTNDEVLRKLQNWSRQQQQKIFMSSVIEFVLVIY